MTITYTKITDSAYSEERDDTEFYGDDFEYTPPEDELNSHICGLVFEDYFNSKGDKDEIIKGIKSFISDHDIQPILEEYYYDSIKSHFESQAFDCLND